MKATITISNAEWRASKWLSAELLKDHLEKRQAKPPERPRLIRVKPGRQILLRRRLGFANMGLPAEMLVIERGGKWFNVAGWEITDRPALLACYHNPNAEPEPRYGRIAGHTRAPKSLSSNWPKPEQSPADFRLWRFSCA